MILTLLPLSIYNGLYIETVRSLQASRKIRNGNFYGTFLAWNDHFIGQSTHTHTQYKKLWTSNSMLTYVIAAILKLFNVHGSEGRLVDESWQTGRHFGDSKHWNWKNWNSLSINRTWDVNEYDLILNLIWILQLTTSTFTIHKVPKNSNKFWTRYFGTCCSN